MTVKHLKLIFLSQILVLPLFTLTGNIPVASVKLHEEKHLQEFIPDQKNLSLKIDELKQKLIMENIPAEWFDSNLTHEKFKFHHKIAKYFSNMPENKVDKQEKDFEWYKKYFAIDKRVEKGRAFINQHKEILEIIEQKNGIHYELPLAILGLESNFADEKKKGKFYTFNALVSQYVLLPKRENFAKKELVALYKFSRLINRDTYYFIGSYAGASGWAQFIPTSQLAFFVDFGGIMEEVDIYDVSDNLTSIENYLHKHGLNGENIHEQIRLSDAVYAYNHSKAYVEAVLLIYQGLRADREVNLKNMQEN